MKTPGKYELNRWLAEEFLGWRVVCGGPFYPDVWLDRHFKLPKPVPGEEDFFNPEGLSVVEDELLLRELSFELTCYPSFKRKFYAKIGLSLIDGVSDNCKYTAFYSAIRKAVDK